MANRASKSSPDLRDYIGLAFSTAAGGLSEIADLGGHTLAAIQMSTAWTDAPITFFGSFKSSASSDLLNVFSSTGGEISYATTASRMMAVDPVSFLGFRFLQLRSGDASTAVAQVAARQVYL